LLFGETLKVGKALLIDGSGIQTDGIERYRTSPEAMESSDQSEPVKIIEVLNGPHWA
jgi:hypothetical protein